MKAIIYTRYGSPGVLHLKEMGKPVPKDHEVLIKIYATTVTTGDVNARGFVRIPSGFKPFARLMFGIRGPRRTILGYELAGEIEAVGRDVKLFKSGDHVFGVAGTRFGAYAEYMCLPESGVLATMPANLTYDEAAAIPFGALTALFFLRDKGKVQDGQKVLINGASGGVGSYAVQLAKYYGAEVTGVCSTANVDLVRSLGADRVVDYTKENFTKSGEIYDIIFDTVNKISFSDCKDSIKPGGLFLVGAGGPQVFVQMLWTSAIGSKKVVAGVSSERKEDLVFLKELAEAGKIRPVIDRRYPLEETADAHRYVDKGHKRGSVVITVAQDDRT